MQNVLADIPHKLPTKRADLYQQHLVAGGELLKCDRIQDAKKEFLSALSIKTGDNKALGLLGLTYFRMSAFAQALPIYEQLVEGHPNNPSYRLNLGLVHLKLGNALSAIAHLERTRELDPNLTRAVSYLALAYAHNGQYGKAYETFLQAGQPNLAQEMQRHLTEVERANVPPAIPHTRDAAQDSTGTSATSARKPPHPPNRSRPYPSIERNTSLAPTTLPATRNTGQLEYDDQVIQTLAGYATSQLIRPSANDPTFTIRAGGTLVVRIKGKLISRTDGVISSGGALHYEPALRKAHGGITNPSFAHKGGPLFEVSGQGHLVVSPLDYQFTSVFLDDDILYLREELIYAFEDQLEWETGYIPGSKIAMIQFRGKGRVTFRTRKPLLAIKATSDETSYVDAQFLAGWIGRVIPRSVTSEKNIDTSEPFVECTGEGVVLVRDHSTRKH